MIEIKMDDRTMLIITISSVVLAILLITCVINQFISFFYILRCISIQSFKCCSCILNLCFKKSSNDYSKITNDPSV